MSFLATRAQCAHAVFLFLQGVSERKITHQTKVTSGNLHRLSNDVAWVLDGLQKLSCVPDFNCSQNVTNHLAMLSRMVRWGAPVEALDVLRVAHRHQVPGLGRQRDCKKAISKQYGAMGALCFASNLTLYPEDTEVRDFNRRENRCDLISHHRCFYPVGFRG
jgi:hypothetical protein